MYGGDSDEVFMVATRNGYLRLGVEFLKAGFAPHVPPEKHLGQRPHSIEVELDYLMTEDSDLHLDYFERREELTISTHEESWSDRAISYLVISMVLSVIALAVVGLVTLIKMLL